MRVRAACNGAERGVASSLEQIVAEALPGSVAAMMRAAGFTNEKDFFKAVEAGQIMANDVLPKFAIELKKVANTNGALTQATKKTRAEMNRFFNQLTEAKDTIFQSGMDDGLSYMFGTLSQTLEDLAPIAKAFGGAFKGALSTMTAALKIVLLPLEVFTKLLSGFDMSDRSSGWLWSVVGAGGSLFLLASGFNKVAIAVGAVNTGLLVMMGHILRLLIPALLLEDIVGSLMGKNSVLNVKGGVESVGTDFGATWWAAQNPMAYLGTKMFMGQNPFSVNVVVTPDGSEFGKAVKATVDNENQKQQATLSSEGGG